MNKTFKVRFGTSSKTDNKSPIKQTDSVLISSPALQPKTDLPLTNNCQSPLVTQSYTKQIKIRVPQRQLKSISLKNIQQFFNNNLQNDMTHQQLINLIKLYQSQIQHLKNYLHCSDLSQRSKISQIFGFTYNCCHDTSQQSCKYLIQQLSTKIKQLINQNHQLKSKTTQIKGQRIQPSNNYHDKIEYKNYICYQQPQDYQQINPLKQQISKLKTQNYQLNQLLLIYQNRISILQLNNAQQKSLIFTTPIKPSCTTNNKQIKNQSFLSLSYSPIQNTSNISNNIQLQTQQKFQEKLKSIQPKNNQIRNVMFGIDQQISNRSQQNQQQITKIINKMKNLENQLKHEKQQTDDCLHHQPHIQGQYYNNLIHRNNLQCQKYETPIIENQNNYDHRLSPKEQNTQLQMQPNQNTSKQLQIQKQKLSKYQQHDNNNISQINILKSKLNQIQKQLQYQRQKNAHLQNLISQQQKQFNTYDNQQIEFKQIKQEISAIRQSLKICQTYHYPRCQQLSNDDPKTSNQNNQNRQIIQSAKDSQPNIKNNEKQENLSQYRIRQLKINQLTKQNSLLLQKIQQLQSQHHIDNKPENRKEIESLNSINQSQMMQPTEINILKEQQEIKNKIENSISRLEKLQNKIGSAYRSRNT